MGSKRVIVGYDHRGKNIKDIVLYEVARSIGEPRDSESVVELDPVELDPQVIDGKQDNSVDYPLTAESVALSVVDKSYTFGILICGTGIGMSIAANKVPGCRAAHVNNTYDAAVTRQHNDANVLCLGSDCFDPDKDTSVIQTIVNIFLTTSFRGGRHARRVRMISEMERRRSLLFTSELIKKCLSDT